MQPTPPVPASPPADAAGSPSQVPHWSQVLRDVAGRALVAFGLTVLLVVGVGIVVGIACGFLGAAGSSTRGLIVGAVALLICAAAAVPLAVYRAAARAAAEGCKRFRLAGRVLGTVFERLLGVADDRPVGDRGGAVTRAVERVPLAEAEARLHSVLARLEPPAGARGLRAAIQRIAHKRMVDGLRRYTLAEFRRADATGGGVDLARLRDVLVRRADDWVGGQILAKSTLLVGLAVGVAVVVLPVLAWASKRLSPPF